MQSQPMLGPGLLRIDRIPKSSINITYRAAVEDTGQQILGQLPKRAAAAAVYERCAAREPFTIQGRLITFRHQVVPVNRTAGPNQGIQTPASFSRSR